MKKNNLTRRDFTKITALTGIGVGGVNSLIKEESPFLSFSGQDSAKKYKLSLNIYSFNEPLTQGKLTISDLLDFCAKTGFDGVDLTGYYFKGYPQVPSDDYIYSVKKKAFNLGLYINGTGVRNDFTWSDPEKRSAEKKLVRDWIIVAQKLGAPSLRIFTGNLSKENFSWEERAKWIADDIRECAEFGKNHGIMMSLQNHNDFLRNASEIEKLLKMINHEWVGLMLDIGSYHIADPYTDIARNSKYAISWQLKEKVFINEKEVDTDYSKIKEILIKCGYKGYLPIETLGEGDPVKKVEALFNTVTSILNS
jgi:sugar phosphate isomerase/epimerase